MKTRYYIEEKDSNGIWKIKTGGSTNLKKIKKQFDEKESNCRLILQRPEIITEIIDEK